LVSATAENLQEVRFFASTLNREDEGDLDAVHEEVSFNAELIANLYPFGEQVRGDKTLGLACANGTPSPGVIAGTRQFDIDPAGHRCHTVPVREAGAPFRRRSSSSAVDPVGHARPAGSQLERRRPGKLLIHELVRAVHCLGCRGTTGKTCGCSCGERTSSATDCLGADTRGAQVNDFVGSDRQVGDGIG
jgi:hypothetical protein